MMSLVERVLDNITNKQAETSSNLNLALRTFLQSNGKIFSIKLDQKLANHLEESVNHHSNKIIQYLFQQNPNFANSQLQVNEQIFTDVLLAKKQKQIQEKQYRIIKPTDKLMKQKFYEQQFNISKDDMKKRKINAENGQNSIENLESNNSNRKQKHQEAQNLQQYNPSQKKSNLKTTERKKNKNFNIRQKDRTQSLQQKQSNIDKAILISNSVDKRLNKKDLQKEDYNIRSKSFKAKSRKLKTNLIKLTPIAQEKQRQQKINKANQRIQATIQFLNNLPSRKKAISIYQTEWRQQKSQNYAINKNNSSPLNNNYLKLKELAEKYRKQKSHQVQANMLQMSGVTRKRYKEQKGDKFSLQKPQAYNLYSVNMLKNQIFQLKKL